MFAKLVSFTRFKFSIDDERNELRTHVTARNAVAVDAILRRNHSNLRELVNSTAVDGDEPTLLQICVANSDLESAKILLKSGANPLRMDRLQATSLHSAAAQGRVDMLKLFFKVGSMYTQQ
jgi:ankyrin repeat protein